MGKTGKWFRSFLGSRKSPECAPREKKKGKGALSKPADSPANLKNTGEPPASPLVEGLDASKHAIAVAAATAAVAEAALAAAQAAAEVVRLTSGVGSGRSSAGYASSDRRRFAAAVKIQSGFRAYLARRALRALKGLVKLQALVRGHIVRKQTANMLRRMQAMARIQARASANRAYVSESSFAKKFSNSRNLGVVNQKKYEQQHNNPKHNDSFLKQYSTRSRAGNNVNKETCRLSSSWLDHWMEQCTSNNRQDTSSHPTRHGDDERGDKILEVDTWKPDPNTTRIDRAFATSQNFSSSTEMGQEYLKLSSYPRLSSKLQKPNPSISSEEASSVISANFTPHPDQAAAWTAENSPRVHSASSRPASNLRGTFTPMKSDCSRSLFGDYLGHPNYMSNTESSRAKVRSQSAPKQRIHFEELGLNAKFGHHLWESDANSEKGSVLSSGNIINTNLHSSHFKKQGMSTRGARSISLSASYGHRF